MKYSAFEYREKTDKLFTCETGSVKYKSVPEKMVDFTCDSQLKDARLWALMVDQFRIGNTDDDDNGWRGEYWGKMMRGACFTYCCTKDETLYNIIEASCRDMLTAQDDLGRFSTYSVGKEYFGWDVWCRKYIMLGYEYFLEFCKDEILADEIIIALKKHADYMINTLGEGEGKRNIFDTSDFWLGINSSSILEPFVKLFVMTKEKKYLDFAEYIIESGGAKGFDLFEAAFENKLYPYQYPTTKAYEMMSCFEGLLEYYRVTGIEKYRVATENFVRALMNSDITLIGSAGTTHELFDHSRIHQFDPEYKGIMQETCVTVTWMKLCHQMLCLTGDSVFADEMEKSAYNALYGAVNVNGNVVSGQVFTFDSYSPLLNGVRGLRVGGHKDLIGNRFWWGCCVAIANAGTALVPLTAVMKSKCGIVVNFFIPGKAEICLPDGKAVFDIKTDYPKNGAVEIILESNIKCPVSIRIPAWSKSTKLTVNGEETTASSGTYVTVEREWKKGDIISLDLDMKTRIINDYQLDEEMTENDSKYFALCRGPVVLARDSQFGEDVSLPVNIENNNGFADVKETENNKFNSEQCYSLKTNDGEIMLCDYASCGQTYNKDLPVTVWMKK